LVIIYRILYKAVNEMQKKRSYPDQKITCIINPHAANKKWKRNILLRKYIQNKLPGQIIDTHENKESTISTAKNLCLKNDIIVAAGGDGTIADIIQGIVQSEKPKDVSLGIIPLGSGNAFCISLHIPLNVAKAIRIITEGKTREIDLIDFDGKVATFGSIGATAQVLLEKLKHRVPGFFGHILAAKIMLKLSRKEQEVELIDGIDDSGEHFDKKHLKLKVFDAHIGKTRHFGYGWKMAPKAIIDDGYIDITFFEISSWKFLLYFPRIYFGTFQQTQQHFKAKKILFKGKNLPIQYNGELLGKRDQIELKILPKAINVISPS